MSSVLTHVKVFKVFLALLKNSKLRAALKIFVLHLHHLCIPCKWQDNLSWGLTTENTKYSSPQENILLEQTSKENIWSTGVSYIRCCSLAWAKWKLVRSTLHNSRMSISFACRKSFSFPTVFYDFLEEAISEEKTGIYELPSYDTVGGTWLFGIASVPNDKQNRGISPQWK